ncbi:hypothetical protein [Hahella sp. HN01]|uniref:hypothetical protein n=1 Tax=unclassified Hahella TaxID=2624107 RepID=UPI001C1E9C71|nr:hypothetical protein [Hahella sp. HN01]MBU6954035.1 hypothetical protein [Hahella sp. HN01]
MNDKYSFFDKLTMVFGGGVGVYFTFFFFDKVLGIEMNTDIHAVPWWMLLIAFVAPIVFVILFMLGFRAIKIMLFNAFFK